MIHIWIQIFVKSQEASCTEDFHQLEEKDVIMVEGIGRFLLWILLHWLQDALCVYFKKSLCICVSLCVCVCVCMCCEQYEREKQTDRQSGRQRLKSAKGLCRSVLSLCPSHILYHKFILMY